MATACTKGSSHLKPIQPTAEILPVLKEAENRKLGQCTVPPGQGLSLLSGLRQR